MKKIVKNVWIAGGGGAKDRANTIYERLFWAAAQEETALLARYGTAATGLTPCFDQAAPYYEQARLVFLCRKLYRQDMEESAFLDKGLLEKWYDNDLHRMFIGEIVKVLEKE